MSHVVDMKLTIDDLGCLEEAVKELGGEIIEKDTYQWWGDHVGDYPIPEGFTESDLGRCDFALHFPNSHWEVGVVKRDNHFHCLFDFYGSDGKKLEGYIGHRGGKLKQSYVIARSKKAARMKGRCSTQEKLLDNGTRRLVITMR